MDVKSISPTEAHRLVAEGGAVLIDIRERHEIEREQIAGAVAMPLTALDAADLQPARGRKAIFFCHSGARTRMYAGQLAAKAQGVCPASYAMSGGIVAWRKAGFDTVKAPRPPGLLTRLFGGNKQ